MRTRLVPLLVSVLAAAAPLAVSATPAHAACSAPTVVLTEVDPNPVVVGTVKVKQFGVYVAVRTNGCTLGRVRAVVTSPTGGSGTIDLERYSSKDGVSSYAGGLEVAPEELVDDDAGSWSAKVTVASSGSTVTKSTSLRVLRAARLTLNATPEPVAKGRTITVTGTLTRASWDSLKYGGYTKRDVRLQFKPAGGAYSTVKTIPSASAGALRTTVTASKDGCFRLVFGGSATTSKVTSTSDCVDVR
jgi:hypothetical protein